MNGHGIGRLQFTQLGEIIVHHPIIKSDRHGLHLQIDLGYGAHIAIKHAGANGAAVGFFPYDIIIIADLHDRS